MKTCAPIKREDLLHNFSVLVHAMQRIYSLVSPLRFSLRYINLIHHRAIASALGSDVQWSELVAKDFIRVPCGLAGLERIAFGAEYSGPKTSRRRP